MPRSLECHRQQPNGYVNIPVVPEYFIGLADTLLLVFPYGSDVDDIPKM